ncbi:FAD-dependent oxidoreductase [Flexithrix dorotheae]|uniref:FAD-dependent oxidoreductase n=1 Tax=Flexithrix dorotheae TaxID=70993 RepID=UPI000370F67D|nr:FAD-dependent oxidoreductase [Flexithrix dorotheae]
MKRETIIIIGGLSAGPSAAAKARRTNEHSRIILFERSNFLSYATCGIPYALSGKVKSREELMVVSAKLLRDRFKIEVHLNEEIIDIDSKAQEIITQKGDKFPYDKLIFATGTNANTPPIKGIETSQNWSHCKTIENFDKIIADKVLENSQNVVVIGAGLIGIEVTENLVKAGKNVTVIELSGQVLPIWESKFGRMAKSVLEEHGVIVKTNVFVVEFLKNTREILLNNGEKINCDYLIVSVGVKPNTDLLLAEGAEHLKNGALVVNEKMETSIPNIYAAGDCASIKNQITGKQDYFPMGTHSNKGGRTAGTNAAGGNNSYKGGYATGIVKVFDYTLGRTGLNAKSLKENGIPFKSNFFIAKSTPGFYPNAKDIFIEIYHDPDSKEIIGAEIFGESGVDKRIDVLSTCIYAKLKIDDLPNLDLAYAPPYSPAKDPVIVAGYIADNANSTHFEEWNACELDSFLKATKEDYQLVDVREPSELQKFGQIPQAKNIPLDQLRENIELLDVDKTTIVYCQRGLRGYLAALILASNHFSSIKNLGGGYLAWKKIIRKSENSLEKKLNNNLTVRLNGKLESSEV